MTEREEKAKSWLNRNYKKAEELEALRRRLEQFESYLEKVCKPIRLHEVMELQSGNNQEEKMAEYIDLSHELGKQLAALARADSQTLRVINLVESSILRTILIERYINRLNWNKIAEHVHLERSRVFDLHRQALSAVLPYIPEEAK